MSHQRPSLFIGSSTEGLAIAEAIQLNLDRDCQVTIWSQGVFGLSQGTLEGLAESVSRFDFAALVLTPDDLVLSGEATRPSPRDNVLLELGMFIGAIGRRRTFIVTDRSKNIKLPTDLAGVTLASFEPHDDDNFAAALGPVCTQIKQAIRQLGTRTRSELTGIIDPDTEYLVVADLLGDPANQFLIQMLEQSCSFVRRSGFISHSELYEYAKEGAGAACGGFDFDKLCKQLPDADLIRQDLRGRIWLTARGQEYASWLIKNGRRADYFWSKIGTWGERPQMMHKMGVRERSVEPGAAPNGGPATPLGSSGVVEGPPSVS